MATGQVNRNNVLHISAYVLTQGNVVPEVADGNVPYAIFIIAGVIVLGAGIVI